MRNPIFPFPFFTSSIFGTSCAAPGRIFGFILDKFWHQWIKNDKLSSLFLLPSGQLTKRNYNRKIESLSVVVFNSLTSICRFVKMLKYAFLDVPNDNIISCCNSSLLECSPAVQEVVGSNPGRDMSVSGAPIKNGDDLGLSIVVTPMWFKGADLQVSDSQGASLVSAIRVKAMLILVILHLSFRCLHSVWVPFTEAVM